MENQIDEIEREKRFLKRYRKNKACIRRLENKLFNLNTRINSPGSPNYSGMPRGGTPVGLDDLIADAMEIESRIERLKRKGKKIKNEILEEIDSLEDCRYCEILEAYFIDCISLDDIADKEYCTVRHIYRLYSEAIKLLALKGQ